MMDVSFLQKDLRGVKSAFLIREGEVLSSHTGDMKMKFLSTSIFFLAKALHDKGKSVKKITIKGSNRFFAFFKGSYMLGVVASHDVNVPLLNVAARRILEQIEP